MAFRRPKRPMDVSEVVPVKSTEGQASHGVAPGPVSRRGAIRLNPEIGKCLVCILIGTLGYSQHVKPFCAGQEHSMPSSSRILHAYPCTASAMTRATFMVRNIGDVYLDMFKLGPRDRWVSVQLALIALNLVLVVLLTRHAYRRVFGGFFSQFYRLFAPAYLLLASYSGVAPTAAGRWYLTQHPFLDLTTNLLFPVSITSECVYCFLVMAIDVAIWTRYSQIAAPTTPTTPTPTSDPFTALDASTTSLPFDPSSGPFATAEPSNFRLDHSLPFQLFLCVACNAASLLMEWWRRATPARHPSGPGAPAQSGPGLRSRTQNKQVQGGDSTGGAGAAGAVAAGGAAVSDDEGAPVPTPEPAARVEVQDDYASMAAAPPSIPPAITTTGADAEAAVGSDAARGGPVWATLADIAAGDAATTVATQPDLLQRQRQPGKGQEPLAQQHREGQESREHRSKGLVRDGSTAGVAHAHLQGERTGEEGAQAATAFQLPSFGTDPPGHPGDVRTLDRLAGVLAARAISSGPATNSDEDESVVDRTSRVDPSARANDGRTGASGGAGGAAAGQGDEAVRASSGGSTAAAAARWLQRLQALKNPQTWQSLRGQTAKGAVSDLHDMLAGLRGAVGDGRDGMEAAELAASAAGLAVQQARRPVYVPRVRLVTTHLKIQGAQPSQLPSDYSQRLEDMVSAQGKRLMGAYVRAGCIELVLDSTDWVDSAEGLPEGDLAAPFHDASGRTSGRDSEQLPPPLMLPAGAAVAAAAAAAAAAAGGTASYTATPPSLTWPRYRSAPSTPSLVQRQQQQRLAAAAAAAHEQQLGTASPPALPPLADATITLPPQRFTIPAAAPSVASSVTPLKDDPPAPPRPGRLGSQPLPFLRPSSPHGFSPLSAVAPLPQPGLELASAPAGPGPTPDGAGTYVGGGAGNGGGDGGGSGEAPPDACLNGSERSLGLDIVASPSSNPLQLELVSLGPAWPLLQQAQQHQQQLDSRRRGLGQSRSGGSSGGRGGSAAGSGLLVSQERAAAAAAGTPGSVALEASGGPVYGGSSGSSHSTGGQETDLDLDLGAVIRALQIPVTDGSLEAVNNPDLEYDARLDGSAGAGQCGGGGGGGTVGGSWGSKDASTPPTMVATFGRRGSGGELAHGLAPLPGFAAPATANGTANPALLLAPPSLPPSLSPTAATSGPPSAQRPIISRQALILGGPSDPLAPGLVTITPRVFAVRCTTSIGSGTEALPAAHAGLSTTSHGSMFAVGAPTAPLPTLLSFDQCQMSYGGGTGGGGAGTAGGPAGVVFSFPPRIPRFQALVRRKDTFAAAAAAAAAATAAATGTAGATADNGSSGEITFRARGDYLAVLASRTTVLTAGGADAALAALAEGTGTAGRGEDQFAGVGGGISTASATWYEKYDVELTQPPRGPGLLLADFRPAAPSPPPQPLVWRSVPVPVSLPNANGMNGMINGFNGTAAAAGPNGIVNGVWVGPAVPLPPAPPAPAPRAVPVVAVADPEVAEELQEVVDRWEGSPAELDDLLLDLGTWGHHVASQARLLLAETVAFGGLASSVPAVQGAAASHLASPSPPWRPPSLDSRLADLGLHLLSYAEVCGWTATAASLRSELALFGVLPDPGTHAALSARPQDPEIITAATSTTPAPGLQPHLLAQRLGLPPHLTAFASASVTAAAPATGAATSSFIAPDMPFMSPAPAGGRSPAVAVSSLAATTTAPTASAVPAMSAGAAAGVRAGTPGPSSSFFSVAAAGRSPVCVGKGELAAVAVALVAPAEGISTLYGRSLSREDSVAAAVAAAVAPTVASPTANGLGTSVSAAVAALTPSALFGESPPRLQPGQWLQPLLRRRRRGSAAEAEPAAAVEGGVASTSSTAAPGIASLVLQITAGLKAGWEMVSKPAFPKQLRHEGKCTQLGAQAEGRSGAVAVQQRYTSTQAILRRELSCDVSNDLCGSGGGGTGEDEEAEFRSYQFACLSAQSWIIQMLDVLSMAVLLFRGRSETLFSPSSLVTLLACCVGTVTAAARLVLPYHRWLAFAEAAKVPRHLCYCATKFLVGVAGLPAPPGIAAYELGAAVFIFEGVVVPWSCVLSVGAAAAVGALKVPLYMALWHRLAEPLVAASSATSSSPSTQQLQPPQQELPNNLFLSLTVTHRLLRALAISGLSVAVTAACHAYIRAAYGRARRRRRELSREKQQRAVGGGVATAAAVVGVGVGLGVEAAAPLEVEREVQCTGAAAAAEGRGAVFREVTAPGVKWGKEE